MNNTRSISKLSAKLTKYQLRANNGDENKRDLYSRKVKQYKTELEKLGVQQVGGNAEKLYSQQNEIESALAELKQSIKLGG